MVNGAPAQGLVAAILLGQGQVARLDTGQFLRGSFLVVVLVVVLLLVAVVICVTVGLHFEVRRTQQQLERIFSEFRAFGLAEGQLVGDATQRQQHRERERDGQRGRPRARPPPWP